MHRIRSHLTYSNVMATLAVFLVLGGGAYAAFHLPKNSVRSRNIVNGQVKKRDLGAPLKFKDAGLTDNCNGVTDGYSNQQPNFANRAAYARDAFGVVHLHGYVEPCGSPQPTMFTLPPGYRPAKEEFFAAGAPTAYPNGFVNATGPGNMALDGITFRCAPSGKNGCP
jgi:hypothetical protein